MLVDQHSPTKIRKLSSHSVRHGHMLASGQPRHRNGLAVECCPLHFTSYSVQIQLRCRTRKNRGCGPTSIPVSLPRAATHCAAATAAAEPPEDPPGTRSGSWGLHVICSSLRFEHKSEPQRRARKSNLHVALGTFVAQYGEMCLLAAHIESPGSLSTRWSYPCQRHPYLFCQ